MCEIPAAIAPVSAVLHTYLIKMHVEFAEGLRVKVMLKRNSNLLLFRNIFKAPSVNSPALNKLSSS